MSEGPASVVTVVVGREMLGSFIGGRGMSRGAARAAYGGGRKPLA